MTLCVVKLQCCTNVCLYMFFLNGYGIGYLTFKHKKNEITSDREWLESLRVKFLFTNISFMVYDACWNGFLGN